MEQAIYYCRILCFKDRIFEHNILDFFVELEVLPCFHRIIDQLDQLHLKRFLRFNHGWNREIILQFYATLYVSGNLNDCSTWIFEWMTETEKITCSADQFIAMLHFPRFEFDKSQEHRLHFWDVTKEQLHLLMEPTKVGDACPADHSPKNLTYENMILFCMMCNSLTPVNRSEKIERQVRNTLQAISMGTPFDLEDLFLRNLASATEYP